MSCLHEAETEDDEPEIKDEEHGPREVITVLDSPPPPDRVQVHPAVPPLVLSGAPAPERLHTMTEREFQDLIRRIRCLEDEVKELKEGKKRKRQEELEVAGKGQAADEGQVADGGGAPTIDINEISVEVPSKRQLAILIEESKLETRNTTERICLGLNRIPGVTFTPDLVNEWLSYDNIAQKHAALVKQSMPPFTREQKQYMKKLAKDKADASEIQNSVPAICKMFKYDTTYNVSLITTLIKEFIAKEADRNFSSCLKYA